MRAGGVVPEFLTIDDVLALQDRLIDEFGGSRGVRDMGLLKSALGMPASGFGGQYLHETLPDMAAAYLYHLVMNHPFVDGNKRIGAAAARVFLLMNDAPFDPEPDEYTDMVLNVAEGKRTKPMRLHSSEGTSRGSDPHGAAAGSKQNTDPASSPMTTTPRPMAGVALMALPALKDQSSLPVFRSST